MMPYADPDQRRAYNRRWDRTRRVRHRRREMILCPDCPNLMWSQSRVCRECYLASMMVDRPPLKPASGNRRTDLGRPQGASHPWRKSLTAVGP